MHFVGEMAGSTPAPSSVDDLLARQPELEARLAAKAMAREALRPHLHAMGGVARDRLRQGISLIVAPAKASLAAEIRADRRFARLAGRASQAASRRSTAIPVRPSTAKINLVAQIFGSAVIDALVKAAAMPVHQPRNLPFASLGDLFKGREEALDELRAALAGAKGGAVAGRALHGLGGIGKTRLAIEYALGARGRLFGAAVRPRRRRGGAEREPRRARGRRDSRPAGEGGARGRGEDRGGPALARGPPDLAHDPRQRRRRRGRRRGGEPHAAAQGRACDRHRARGEFPGALRTFELDALDEDAATQFLLERTAERSRGREGRRGARRGALARELGGLALGLEQAGAHIATERIGFARYLRLWSEKRDKVLAWSDPTLTGSDKTLADDLGDVGRAAFRRKAAACSTGSPCWRPTRSRTRSSTSRFPARPQGYDALRGARGPLRLFARHAGDGRGRRGRGFRHASPGAGFRAPRDDGGAARARRCGRRWAG